LENKVLIVLNYIDHEMLMYVKQITEYMMVTIL
jgi:hypothetical protein